MVCLTVGKKFQLIRSFFLHTFSYQHCTMLSIFSHYSEEEKSITKESLSFLQLKCVDISSVATSVKKEHDVTVITIAAREATRSRKEPHTSTEADVARTAVQFSFTEKPSHRMVFTAMLMNA